MSAIGCKLFGHYKFIIKEMISLVVIEVTYDCIAMELACCKVDVSADCIDIVTALVRSGTIRSGSGSVDEHEVDKIALGSDVHLVNNVGIAICVIYNCAAVVSCRGPLNVAVELSVLVGLRNELKVSITVCGSNHVRLNVIAYLIQTGVGNVITRAVNRI